jgi:hypothetical protein
MRDPGSWAQMARGKQAKGLGGGSVPRGRRARQRGCRLMASNGAKRQMDDGVGVGSSGGADTVAVAEGDMAEADRIRKKGNRSKSASRKGSRRRLTELEAQGSDLLKCGRDASAAASNSRSR